ncbi:MAG: WbuC family cupin fold metalloprotein [Bacteroidota bacterium]
MICVDERLIDKLILQAKGSERKRTVYCFHHHPGDTLQRMLNAMEPGTYVVPHKHQEPDKREVFFLVRGKALIVIFDKAGNISNKYLMDTPSAIVEISPRSWHTIIPLVSGTVLYEVKDGPYDPASDKFFAPWAPDENDPEAKEYVQQLLKA